jgi:hypothetical protein
MLNLNRHVADLLQRNYIETRMDSIVGPPDASLCVTDASSYDVWGNILHHRETSSPNYGWLGTVGDYETCIHQYFALISESVIDPKQSSIAESVSCSSGEIT